MQDFFARGQINERKGFMNQRFYSINNPSEYAKAGAYDLIKLIAETGENALYLPKYQLETLVYAIVHSEAIHLSGPTGSGKTNLIKAMWHVPENFNSVCMALGYPVKPLKICPVEMATYETPGELYSRRSLRDGCTYDEESEIVQALKSAAANEEDCYHCIWLREIGRTHSSSVQGGLLDLMTPGDVTLPGGKQHISTGGTSLAWIADSNYAATDMANHTLTTFDDALKRRFTVNLTLEYLSPDQEVDILSALLADENIAQDADLMKKTIQLGKLIRHGKEEGNFQSIVPPTISGYLAYYKMALQLSHHSHQQVAMDTMLGNGSTDERNQIVSLLNTVFGLQNESEETKDELQGSLF